MKIKRIVSLFLVLVLALSAVAVLGSCKKEEKKIGRASCRERV